MVTAELPQPTLRCSANQNGFVAGNVVSSITHWNEQAIALVQTVDDCQPQIATNSDGRLDEALAIINQALLQMDVHSKLSNVDFNQPATPNRIVYDTAWLISSISTSLSVADITLPPSLCDAMETHNDFRLPSQEQPEYDEGMNCFSQLLPIDCDVALAQTATNKIFSSSEPISLWTLTRPAIPEPKYHSCCHLASIMMYNLGQIRNRQKRHDEAYACFIESYRLIASIEVLAKVPSMVVRILHNLGYIQYRDGNVVPSLRLFKMAHQVLNNSTDAGLNLTETATTVCRNAYMAATLNCLGVLYFHLPNFIEDSTEYLSKSLSLQRELMHIVDAQRNQCTGMIPIASLIASTLNNIGRLIFMNRENDLAIDVFTESLQMRRQQLGNDHLDVAGTIFNLGHAHYEIREYDTALLYCQEFLRITKPLLGIRHRDVAYVLKCVAHMHNQQKNYIHAIEAYHEALVSCDAVFGIHFEVATICNKLGNLYHIVEEYDLALLMYERGLRIESIVYEPYHLNISITVSNIAQIYKIKGNIAQSLHLYEQVYILQVSSFGHSDPIVAITLSNIAFLQYQFEEYHEAYESFQEVLRIRRMSFGDMSLQVAATLNSMGLVKSKLGDINISLQHFMHSYEIRHSELGDSHSDVAISLHNIATILLAKGKYEMAIQTFMEALRVEQTTFGPDHKDIIPTLQHLAKLHKKNGDINQAINCLREVVRVQWHWHTTNSMEPYPEVQKENINEANGSWNIRIVAMMKTLHRIAALQLQIGNAGGYVNVMSAVCRLYNSQQRSPSSILDIVEHSMLRLRWNGAFSVNDHDEDDDGNNSVTSDEMVSLATQPPTACASPLDLYLITKLHPEAAPMA